MYSLHRILRPMSKLSDLLMLSINLDLVLCGTGFVVRSQLLQTLLQFAIDLAGCIW